MTRLGSSFLGVVLAGFLGGYFLAVARAQVEKERKGACLPLDPVVMDKAAPDFELPSRDGTTVRLRALRGKAVFLNFFLSSCQPCEEEMPGMERLGAALGGKGLAMVAVAADERWEDVDRLFQRVLPSGKTGMTLLKDEGGRVASLYGTRLFPETYLIDREGKIRFYFQGARDWGSKAGQACVESVLAAPGVASTGP